VLLDRVRTLASAFEDLSRLFPTSGYSDDALWHGALLSADAFWEFGEARDRNTAIRLFNALTARFPSSSRVKQVPPHLARLQSAKAAVTPPRSDAGRVVPSGTAAALAPASGSAVLTSIRREVLPDAVRVTIELEREVPFVVERTDSPATLVVELSGARAADPLRNAALTFKDDVVAQVRVAGRPASKTRVTLDLRDAGRFSAYPMYNPYRVVVDFEREPKVPAAPATKTPRTVIAAQPPPKPATDPKPATVAARRPPPILVSRPMIGILTALPSGLAAENVFASPLPLPSPPAESAASSTTSAARGGVSLSRQLGLGVSRIVIDAGHGGHDPGAKISGLTEAEVVLDVALKLEKLLKKESGVEVVLTRRDDKYIALEERTAMANRAGADLFLSIHANASPNEAARGIETYFLNFAPNPEAEAIAARENAGSARTMRNLPDIVKAIALNNKIDESRDFAGQIQSALYDRLRKINKTAKSLGVKQAPFMVLVGATMPSVLAEISFLTNNEEGSLLKTDKYRSQVAEALFAGVMQYQQSLKRAMTVAAR
jgi:N-acetylmuramoyl-L-alanine amidase